MPPFLLSYYCVVVTCSFRLNSLAAANGRLLAAKPFKHISCFIKFLLAGKNSYPV